jgi:hypothetical protein
MWHRNDSQAIHGPCIVSPSIRMVHSLPPAVTIVWVRAKLYLFISWSVCLVLGCFARDVGVLRLSIRNNVRDVRVLRLTIRNNARAAEMEFGCGGALLLDRFNIACDFSFICQK